MTKLLKFCIQLLQYTFQPLQNAFRTFIEVFNEIGSWIHVKRKKEVRRMQSDESHCYDEQEQKKNIARWLFCGWRIQVPFLQTASIKFEIHCQWFIHAKCINLRLYLNRDTIKELISLFILYWVLLFLFFLWLFCFRFIWFRWI